MPYKDKEKLKEYRQKNKWRWVGYNQKKKLKKAENNIRNLKWYYANKKRHKEIQDKSRKKNIEHIRLRLKEYRKRPEVRAKLRIIDNRYYHKHPEKFLTDLRYVNRRKQYKKSERGKLVNRLSCHNRRAKITTKVSVDDWLKIRNASPICPMCGRFVGCENLTIDHIIPIAKGGANTLENLQALCINCNSSKSDYVHAVPKEHCEGENTWKSLISEKSRRRFPRSLKVEMISTNQRRENTGYGLYRNPNI